MKALFDFIITTEDRYDNKVAVGDKELIINTEITERDAEYVKRTATVLATPTAYDTPVRVGDEVIVHHNTFRRWYDVRGKEKNGAAFIDDNTYRVDPGMVFAYKQDDAWRAMDGYCFVEPMHRDTEWAKHELIEQHGTLMYLDSYLEIMNLENGDHVCFTPDCEYEFRIEGKLLYRIHSSQITMYEPKRTTEASA